jgi:hypothetical protein
MHWRLPGRSLTVGQRTLLMGIVNVTPDSFSDGGLYLEKGAAVDLGKRLEADGADIIDIGGESTRLSLKGSLNRSAFRFRSTRTARRPHGGRPMPGPQSSTISAVCVSMRKWSTLLPRGS